MHFEMIFVFAVLLLAVYLFVTEKLPVDLVALLVMALLLVSGIVSPAEGISGFSNTATVTVGAMFVRHLIKDVRCLNAYITNLLSGFNLSSI